MSVVLPETRRPVIERIKKLKSCLSEQDLDDLLKRLSVNQMGLVEKLITAAANKPDPSPRGAGWNYDPIQINVLET